MSAETTLPAALYQGCANTWECDEGGHLNVRFQLERCFAGLALLASDMNMPRAFQAGAGATLLPLDLHVRFLREARPGAPLMMRGGVVELGESDAHVTLDMRHGGGAPATAFNLHVAHVDTRALKPFAWSSHTRDAIAALRCAAPDHALPRSIDAKAPPHAASRARADALGVPRTGGFVVTPDQCDAFGRMRAEMVFARVSDAAPHLFAQWRAMMRAGDANAAGAVVEARMHFLRWPRAGDLIEMRSGLIALEGRTQRVAHWLLEPSSGNAWAVVEAVVLTFDSVTRKTMTPSDQVRASMEAQAIPGMGAPDI